MRLFELDRERISGAAARRPFGRQFGWLWGAYAVSAFGTGLAFGALPLIAILALDAGPTEVSLLAAAGLAVGAAAAVPLGPWVEFRRKRPVMIAMDLARFAASISVPVAYALGRLSFAQLLVVSVILGAAGIAFKAASGAFVKALVEPEDLLAANGRLESTNWTATMLGPPLGGFLIGAFGPVATVVADAVSYLLSALGIGALGGGEPHPERAAIRGSRAGELLEGWRYILAPRELRLLFLNTILFNGLIMATQPLLAVLMLGQLGFPPWQYGLAFAAPCIGGLLGSWVAPWFVDRYGQRRVMLATGTLRVPWPLGLAFVPAGVGGLALVFVLQLAMVSCIGVFIPSFSTYRLEQTESTVVARMLSAWSVTTSFSVAVLTALWGLLAALTGARVAIGIAGLLLLATPLLLPGRERRAGCLSRRIPRPGSRRDRGPERA